MAWGRSLAIPPFWGCQRPGVGCITCREGLFGGVAGHVGPVRFGTDARYRRPQGLWQHCPKRGPQIGRGVHAPSGHRLPDCRPGGRLARRQILGGLQLSDYRLWLDIRRRGSHHLCHFLRFRPLAGPQSREDESGD